MWNAFLNIFYQDQNSSTGNKSPSKNDYEHDSSTDSSISVRLDSEETASELPTRSASDLTSITNTQETDQESEMIRFKDKIEETLIHDIDQDLENEYSEIESLEDEKTPHHSISDLKVSTPISEIQEESDEDVEVVENKKPSINSERQLTSLTLSTTLCDIPSITNETANEDYDRTPASFGSEETPVARRKICYYGEVVYTFYQSSTSNDHIIEVDRVEGLIDPKKGGPKTYELHLCLLPGKDKKWKRSLSGSNPFIKDKFVIQVPDGKDVESLAVRFRLYKTKFSQTLNLLSESTQPLDDIEKNTDEIKKIFLIEKNISYDISKYRQKTALGEDLESNNNDEKKDTEERKTSIFAQGKKLFRRQTDKSHPRKVSQAPARLFSMKESKNNFDINIKLGLAYNAISGTLNIFLNTPSDEEKFPTISKNGAYFVAMTKSKNDQILRMTQSPDVDEANLDLRLTLDLPLFQLKDVVVVLQLISKKSLKGKEIYAYLSMGTECSNSEISDHWHKTLKCKGIPVVQTHKMIRMTS